MCLNKPWLWAPLLVSMSLHTGCALKPSYAASRVQPAYPEMVAHCLFLGGVVGQSSVPYSDYGQLSADYDAKDKAAKLGGTHVVIQSQEEGLTPTVSARVYDCRRAFDAGHPIPVPQYSHSKSQLSVPARP